MRHQVNVNSLSSPLSLSFPLQRWLVSSRRRQRRRVQYKQGVSSSSRDVGKCYVNFVRNCIEQLRHKVLDELWVLNVLQVTVLPFVSLFFFFFLSLSRSCPIERKEWNKVCSFFFNVSTPSLTLSLSLLCHSLSRQQWYTNQINMICTWLTERVDCSLHTVQLSALSQIVKVSCVCVSPCVCNLRFTVTSAIIVLSLCVTYDETTVRLSRTP